jgi:CheY-like chemotaxis protein
LYTSPIVPDGAFAVTSMICGPWTSMKMLVALSGYGSSQDKERSSQAGFDLHLVKPVSADTLSQVLSDTRDR